MTFLLNEINYSRISENRCLKKKNVYYLNKINCSNK